MKIKLKRHSKEHVQVNEYSRVWEKEEKKSQFKTKSSIKNVQLITHTKTEPMVMSWYLSLVHTCPTTT